MKVVLLCGGLGTRLSEETHLVPKPMVRVGDKPILLHIMDIYSNHGIEDFVLALGFKAEVIKEFFLNFYALNNDLRINLSNGSVEHLRASHKDWKIDLIDTGLNTLTGGRLARLKKHVGNETFMLTYGDGVSDINITELIKFHKSHGKIATFTAVRPPSRFGVIEFDGNKATSFKEKPQTQDGWINGGYFVFEPTIFNYLEEGDETILERRPLERLAEEGQLMGFKHEGFWQCMDTLRDKTYLNKIWEEGRAPWAKK
jgi:glucose-1-phosphate cytidylyltransferase